MFKNKIIPLTFLFVASTFSMNAFAQQADHNYGYNPNRYANEYYDPSYSYNYHQQNDRTYQYNSAPSNLVYPYVASPRAMSSMPKSVFGGHNGFSNRGLDFNNNGNFGRGSKSYEGLGRY